MSLGNTPRARRLYGDKFSKRPQPIVQMFINIHAWLCETGSFNKSTNVVRMPATVRNSDKRSCDY